MTRVHAALLIGAATALVPLLVGLSAAWVRHWLERYEARPQDLVGRLRDRSLL